MDDEQSQDYKVIAREKAKQLRKKAYQQAKERMKSDPRYQALKEQAKQKRKEAYQKAKLAHKKVDKAQAKDHSHEIKIYKASEMSDGNFPDNVIPIEWAKLKKS